MEDHVVSKSINKELLSFLECSVSVFHAVSAMREQLLKQSYLELFEEEPWNVEKGGNYFVVRNGSSIIAFSIGKKLENYHFQIAASHSDSPTFKVKEHAEIAGKGEYLQLNTEGYGGMLAATWFDRPLSIAGRVLVKDADVLTTRLVHIDKDLLIIPSVAIHLNRDANNGMKYNNQIDLLPLYSAGDLKEGAFIECVAKELGVDKNNILGKDLYLYNRMKPILWGEKEEFISAGKLDNLQCAYLSLQSFLKTRNNQAINVYACFDNEEVGSATKQGAESTFLRDVLERINNALNYSNDEYYQAVARSFMLSCDNAHATHPNHPELSDQKNTAFMNKGIVIKYNANQRYTTDGVSAAVFQDICKHCNVPLQVFANRSDMPGGSTLGNISSTKVSMNTVDIGLPQLAMHSSFETAGSHDSQALYEALCGYYGANIVIHQGGKIFIDYDVK